MDGAGGQNDSPGFQVSLVCVYQFAAAPVFHGKSGYFSEFHSQPVCVFPELQSHVETVDAGQSQVIVHFISVQHLSPAHGIFFQNH